MQRLFPFRAGLCCKTLRCVAKEQLSNPTERCFESMLRAFCAALAFRCRARRAPRSARANQRDHRRPSPTFEYIAPVRSTVSAGGPWVALVCYRPTVRGKKGRDRRIKMVPPPCLLSSNQHAKLPVSPTCDLSSIALLKSPRNPETRATPVEYFTRDALVSSSSPSRYCSADLYGSHRNDHCRRWH